MRLWRKLRERWGEDALAQEMRAHREMIADRILRTRFRAGINNLSRPIPPDLLHEVSRAVKFLRPDNQIDPGKLVEELGAPALGHASEETEHDVGLAVLVFAHVAHLAERLLFGHVPDAARVEKDDVGFRLVGRQRVALPAELLGHLLRVPLIHLASVGFDVQAGHDSSCLRDSQEILNSSFFARDARSARHRRRRRTECISGI